MEPIERRSDVRETTIAATPAEVYAALSTPERLARWWGPDGFTTTNHVCELSVGGGWIYTMHGPDGTDHPNESRFVRLEPDRVFELEHLNGHHFFLRLELEGRDGGTVVRWRQTFDTAAHYQRLAEFVAVANEQNLRRLVAEVSGEANAN